MAQEKSISVRDGRLEAHVWTSGSGPPVLYLHGWNGMPEWPGWLDGLTDRFTVIAPQHPGYGSSTGLELIDDFIDLAIYYLDFADALGLDRPSLIGHSLGANIAAEMAALSSASVGKLALIAPTGLWDDANPVADIFAMTDGQRSAIQWRDPEDAEARGFIEKPETDEEKQAAMLERTRSLSAAAKFLFPIPDRGLKKRIHRIKAPTLLLWGDSDKIVPPSYAKLFQEKIAGSKAVEVPDAGHQPQLENPDPVLKAIADFLES